MTDRMPQPARDPQAAQMARQVSVQASDPFEQEAAWEAPTKLTEAEKALVYASAIRGLRRVLLAQGAMAIVAAAIAWLVGGAWAAMSTLAGAGSYFIPNALFALRLVFGLVAGRPANPAMFFLGEMFKLVMTVALLWLLARNAHQWVVWPAVLWGLIMTLKGYFLLLMFRKM
jgi:ATP synthase protein I